MFKLRTPVGNLPLSKSNREYSIHKLFNLIAELSKNFETNTVISSLELFFEEFNTKSTHFSIDKLLTLYDKHELNLKDTFYFFELFYYNYFLNSELYLFYYADTIKYKSGNFYNYQKKINRPLKRMGLDVTNPEETFQKVMNTYRKYTQEPYILSRLFRY